MRLQDLNDGVLLFSLEEKKEEEGVPQIWQGEKLVMQSKCFFFCIPSIGLHLLAVSRALLEDTIVIKDVSIIGFSGPRPKETRILQGIVTYFSPHTLTHLQHSSILFPSFLVSLKYSQYKPVYCHFSIWPCTNGEELENHNAGVTWNTLYLALRKKGGKNPAVPKLQGSR